MHIDPEDYDASYKAATLIAEKGDLKNATIVLQALLNKHPQKAESAFKLSVIYDQLKSPKKSQHYLERTLKIDPNHGSANFNYANALFRKGHFEKALSYYLQAQKARPLNTRTQYNLALTQLKLAQWKPGWQHYQTRFNMPEKDQTNEIINANLRKWIKALAQPKWQGENLNNKNILIWSEQGIGDNILFMNNFIELAKKKTQVSFICDKRLHPIIKRSFPQLTLIANNPNARAKIKNHYYDFQCAIGDLCQYFKTETANFPHHNGYLKADKEITQRLRKSYLKKRRDLLIGISWEGGVEKQRSIPIHAWESLLNIPQTTFLNLQHNLSPKEIKGKEILLDQTIDPMKNLNQFANKIQACDLVITVDNTTAHLAGALNVPTWVLLQEPSHWHWLENTSESPWYPSLTIYRKSPTQHWEKIIKTIHTQILKRIKDCDIKTKMVKTDTHLSKETQS